MLGQDPLGSLFNAQLQIKTHLIICIFKSVNDIINIYTFVDILEHLTPPQP